MPTSDFILWIDLETTGNGPDDDIIELGAVLTDKDYVIQSSFARVYRTRRAVSVISPKVLEMHFANGLWRDTIEATSYAADSEDEILAWLGKAGALKGGANSLPLAGSGTSHFDRRYIERDWPSLARRLTYWNLDIGVVRRFLRSWLPEEVQSYVIDSQAGKHHRALADVMQHLQEAIEYRTLMRNLGG